MADKPTSRRRNPAATALRRRTLAVERLEARSLLAVTGLDGGPDEVASQVAWTATATAGQTAVTVRGFAWRFGDALAVRQSGSAAFTYDSPRFGALVVSTPLAEGSGFAKAFIVAPPENSSLRCVVIVGCAKPTGESTPLLTSRATFDAAGQGYNAYLSSVDRVFDAAGRSSLHVWRLSPAATLEQILHDAWSPDHRKDNRAASLPTTLLTGGDRMNAERGSMLDAARGMDNSSDRMAGDNTAADKLYADKLTIDGMRSIGLLPLVPGSAGAIGAAAGGSDRVDAPSGGLSETGGFIALSTASDFGMSPAVASAFTDAAQRIAPLVVLAGESTTTQVHGAATDNGVDAEGSNAVPRKITRFDNADAPATTSGAVEPNHTNAVAVAPRQMADEADADRSSAAPGGTAQNAVDSAADKSASVALADSHTGGRDDDDAAWNNDESDSAAGSADELAAATADEDAYAWAYDEPQGGMIALSVSYLPGGIESPQPAAVAWVVEEARPRGDAAEEPHVESSVGLYQVFDVAAATPESARAGGGSRQVVAASMILPPSNVGEESDPSPPSLAAYAEASLGAGGWLGPNYAAAAASAVVFAAGITFRTTRPVAAARRLVGRFRKRGRSDE